MRLVKTQQGKYAGTDLISLYVDESSQVEYYASNKLLADCKTWDNASVARIVCDTPTKRTYKAIFNKDKRLTAVWLKSLHLHKSEISDVSSIVECLSTMVTEDETVVPEVEELEIPDMDDLIIPEDDDLFGDLDEVEPISMIEVEPIAEVVEELDDIEDDMFSDVTEPEMIDVQDLMEVEEFVEIQEVQEVVVSAPVVASNYHSQFGVGLPSHLCESVACLVRAGIAFTIVEESQHFVIRVDR